MCRPRTLFRSVDSETRLLPGVPSPLRTCQTTWYGEAVPICARAAFQDSWHRVRGPAGYLGTLAGETSNPRHRRRPACRSCIEKVPGLPRLPYCYTDAYENSTRYGTDDLQETTSANLMNGHPSSYALFAMVRRFLSPAKRLVVLRFIAPNQDGMTGCPPPQTHPPGQARNSMR